MNVAVLDEMDEPLTEISMQAASLMMSYNRSPGESSKCISRISDYIRIQINKELRLNVS